MRNPPPDNKGDFEKFQPLDEKEEKKLEKLIEFYLSNDKEISDFSFFDIEPFDQGDYFQYFKDKK